MNNLDYIILRKSNRKLLGNLIAIDTEKEKVLALKNGKVKEYDKSTVFLSRNIGITDTLGKKIYDSNAVIFESKLGSSKGNIIDLTHSFVIWDGNQEWPLEEVFSIMVINDSPTS